MSLMLDYINSLSTQKAFELGLTVMGIVTGGSGASGIDSLTATDYCYCEAPPLEEVGVGVITVRDSDGNYLISREEGIEILKELAVAFGFNYIAESTLSDEILIYAEVPNSSAIMELSFTYAYQNSRYYVGSQVTVKTKQAYHTMYDNEWYSEDGVYKLNTNAKMVKGMPCFCCKSPTNRYSMVYGDIVISDGSAYKISGDGVESMYFGYNSLQCFTEKSLTEESDTYIALFTMPSLLSEEFKAKYEVVDITYGSSSSTRTEKEAPFMAYNLLLAYYNGDRYRPMKCTSLKDSTKSFFAFNFQDGLSLIIQADEEETNG